MTKIPSLLLISALLINAGCQPAGIPLGGDIRVNIKDSKPAISKVVVQNDQLIITGKNLDAVTIAKIEGSTNHNFQIESKSDNQLVLNAKSALSLLVGGTFNLIVSSAKADATFPISFELQNGQVTAAKLHNMGASAGQFLRFNGTNWVPASISSSQIFAGAYDATANSPDIEAIGGTAGTYYIVSVGGTQTFSSGSITFNVGDWVIYNGSVWEKLAVGSNTVSSFKGRTGLVVPMQDDYSWNMLAKTGGKLTGSKVSDIADVDVAGIQDGDILQWNAGGSKWEVNSVPAPTISAGSITNTQIANSAVDSNKIVDGTIVNADISATAAIDQTKINGLTTALSGKEPSLPAGGTTAHYLRGDKTWVTLNSTAVPEGTNLYFTPARVLGTLITTYATGGTGAIAVTDTIPQALSKLETKTNSLGNYVLRDGSSAMTGDLQMGSHKITGLATPTANTDAATKAYVDSVAGGGGSSQWTTAGSDIHFNTGKVGIGTSTPESKLHLKATTGDFITFSPEADDGGGTTLDTKYIIRPTLGNDGGGATFNRAGLQFTHEGSMTIGLFSFDGRVGIGKDEPEYPLDVNGVAGASSFRIKSTGSLGGVILAAPTGLATNLTLQFPATAGSNNQVLTTNGAGVLSWTTPAGGGAPTGSAGGDLSGTYPNPTIAAGLDAAKIGGGAVSNAEFAYLDGVTSSIQTQLNAKEASLPAGGTSGDYLRGDKTWHSLSTDVQASVITSFTPVTGSQVTIADTLLMALQRLQGQINTNSTAITANTTWTKTGTTDVKYVGGNVGIARDPASNTKLDVEGQIRSGSSSITTNAINFAAGNTVSTTHDCGTAMTLANIRDGGSYTVVVTGAGTTQCSFSTSTTGDDANTVTYRFQPANAARTASSHTIYSMLRVGTIIYVSWISGFQ